MAVDINEIAATISNIKKNRNTLDILIEFESILDELHVYAYENWIKGEVIKGPIISKYWVEVYLMYPKSVMPNPEGAMRLIKHGCYVFFEKDVLKSAVKIKSMNDLAATNDERHPGQYKPKTEETEVYIVKVVVPRHLLDDYNVKKINAVDGEVNLDDVIDAYDQGLDVERSTRADEENQNEQQNDEDEFEDF